VASEALQFNYLDVSFVVYLRADFAYVHSLDRLYFMLSDVSAVLEVLDFLEHL
jgi:hypothetical protein